MFTYDPARRRIIDPTNGDELRTLHAHWQSNYREDGILSSEGKLKFSAIWRSYSVDEPESWPPRDGISRAILLDAFEHDDEGRALRVHGPHPQIDRLVDHYRDDASSKVDFVAFEFIDERAANTT